MAARVPRIAALNPLKDDWAASILLRGCFCFRLSPIVWPGCSCHYPVYVYLLAFFFAVKEKKGSQEEAVRILSTRSKTRLIATFNCYREIHGTSITKKLLDEASDDFLKALYTAIRITTDHVKYYEKVLRDAIKRVGTDEDVLTRVIMSRAEIDLKVISEVYYKRNNVLLEHDVAKETSRDYEHFLFTLLGKDD